MLKIENGKFVITRNDTIERFFPRAARYETISAKCLQILKGRPFLQSRSGVIIEPIRPARVIYAVASDGDYACTLRSHMFLSTQRNMLLQVFITNSLRSSQMLESAELGSHTPRVLFAYLYNDSLGCWFLRGALRDQWIDSVSFRIYNQTEIIVSEIRRRKYSCFDIGDHNEN